MNIRLLCTVTALCLVFAAGGVAPDALAANTKSKLPKAQPAKADPSQPKVKSPEAKAARSTDDFRDTDNNGVDDRHEKKAIRPEPAAQPAALKAAPKPAATKQDQPAKAPTPPPKEPTVEPPAQSPPF